MYKVIDVNVSALPDSFLVNFMINADMKILFIMLFLSKIVTKVFHFASVRI
jgi:hypothetical protein